MHNKDVTRCTVHVPHNEDRHDVILNADFTTSYDSDAQRIS
jgi:hypothetical protein